MRGGGPFTVIFETVASVRQLEQFTTISVRTSHPQEQT